MKTFTTKTRVLAGLMALCFASTGWAVSPPWGEGFEAYPVNAALSDVAGWGGTDPSVKVQTNVVWSPALGTNAVVMLPDKIASNMVVSASLTNVWFDFYLTNSMAMAAGSVGGEVIDSNMTVQLYIETNGYPVVWHPVSNAWVVCSNDYWGTPATAFNGNAWMRFTVCANYSNKTAAVFLNQHLIQQQVRFIDTNRTQSGRFQLDGGSAVTSYFDEVSVRYAPTNMTADLDNDGVVDADEIQAKGNVSAIRRLGITLAKTNLTEGGSGGGWWADPATNSFDVPWTMISTTLQCSASNGFYVADLMTNGVSVGEFTGKNTNSASYAWLNSQADATVTVAVARMPVITASNSLYGTTTPALTNAYPANSRRFDFAATNDHYYVADVVTNGHSVGAFTGRGTNAGWFVWSGIVSNGGIEVQYALKPVIAVSVTNSGGPGVAGCSITASSSNVYPGGQVTFSLVADKAYAVASLKTNNVQAFTYAGAPAATNCVISDIGANLDVQGVFAYTARRVVPTDYASLQEAMAAALPGDAIIVNNGASSSELVFSNGVALVATNTTLTGGLMVGLGTTGVVMSCTGLVVNSTTVNGLLVVSNGVVNVGTLAIGAGATVQVVNATAFIANGTTMSGTFTLDASWGAVIRAQTPPFSDDFERYANSTDMASMGFYGWGTPDGGIIVQRSVVTQGVQAVVMPGNTMLSNSLAASASSNVWAEWNYRESGRIDESTVFVTGADTNLTVLLFINTSNYVTVFNPEQGHCNVLSNDVWSQPVAQLSTSDWPRIAVNMNYLTRRAAVMLNGRLLIQELRFINTNQANCQRLEWEAGTAGPSYLDDLKVWTNAVPVNSLDGDGDGTPDAVEIDHSGNVFVWPHGVIFKIR